MSIERLDQLEVWRGAHQIVLEICKATTKLPKDEKFGLISQMGRSAVSVPANIAEGFKRRGAADKRHFYNIAQSSLEELRYYSILCHDLGFDLKADDLKDRINHVGRMLTGLIQSVRS